MAFEGGGFENELTAPPTSPSPHAQDIAIVGRKADENEKEDWGDDFDFGGDNEQGEDLQLRSNVVSPRAKLDSNSFSYALPKARESKDEQGGGDLDWDDGGGAAGAGGSPADMKQKQPSQPPPSPGRPAIVAIAPQDSEWDLEADDDIDPSKLSVSGRVDVSSPTSPSIPLPVSHHEQGAPPASATSTSIASATTGMDDNDLFEFDDLGTAAPAPAAAVAPTATTTARVLVASTPATAISSSSTGVVTEGDDDDEWAAAGSTPPGPLRLPNQAPDPDSDTHRPPKLQLTLPEKPILRVAPATLSDLTEGDDDDENWDLEIEREDNLEPAAAVDGKSKTETDATHANGADGAVGGHNHDKDSSLSMLQQQNALRSMMRNVCEVGQSRAALAREDATQHRTTCNRAPVLIAGERGSQGGSLSPDSRLTYLLSQDSRRKVNIIMYPAPSELFEAAAWAAAAVPEEKEKDRERDRDLAGSPPSPKEKDIAKDKEHLTRPLNEKQLECFLRDAVSKHAKDWAFQKPDSWEVLLGHNYLQTLSAQETLPGLLRLFAQRVLVLFRVLSVQLAALGMRTDSLGGGGSGSASSYLSLGLSVTAASALGQGALSFSVLPPSPSTPSSSSGSGGGASGGGSGSTPEEQRPAVASHPISAEIWKLLAGLFDLMSSRLGTPYVQNHSRDAQSWRLTAELLYIAAKLRHRQNLPCIQLFKRICTAAGACFPDYAPLCELLQHEAIAHHDPTMANQQIRQFVRIYLEHKQTAVSVAASARSNGPLTRKEVVSLEVASRALSDLALYLRNRSPLNTAPLTDHGWDLDSEEFDWIERACSGEQPPPTKKPNPVENLTWELCGNPDARYEALASLFPRLPAKSYLRAKCAFVLAEHMRVHAADSRRKEFSLRTVECLLFESVFALERTPSLVPPFAPVISALGVNAFVEYGNVLLANGKHTYAIPALESALMCYRIRHQVEHHGLVRRLCDVCQENSDFQRAIHYHELILQKSMTDGDLNMYLYIAQQIGKLSVMKGNFRKAEECLLGAVSFLLPYAQKSQWKNSLSKSDREALSRGNTPHSSNNHSHGLSVNNSHLVPPGGNEGGRGNGAAGGDSSPHSHSHSNLFGASGAGGANGNSGINTNLLSPPVGATGFTSPLSPYKPQKIDAFDRIPATEFRNALVTVYLQLARLYLDGDRITSAISVLESLNASELPRGKKSVVHLLLSTAFMKKRMFIKANTIMGHMEKLAETALRGRSRSSAAASHKSIHQFTSLGITVSDIVNTPEFMDARAKNYLYSGNFQQALKWVDIALAGVPDASLSTLARFHYRRGKILQTMLFAQMKNTYAFVGPKAPPKKPGAVVPLLPDPCKCISSLRAAYNYFNKVDDEMGMAKALSRIVETYLQFAFVTVAVLGNHPNELTDWLRTAGFDVTNEATAFSRFLAQMESPSQNALEMCVATLKVRLLLKCYLNIAEIRFLQGQKEASLSYWKEARDSIVALFMNGNQSVLINKTTPGFTANMEALFKRLARLLLCFDAATINQNLRILDSYLLYEMDLYSEFLESNEEKTKQYTLAPHGSNTSSTPSRPSSLCSTTSSLSSLSSSFTSSDDVSESSGGGGGGGREGMDGTRGAGPGAGPGPGGELASSLWEGRRVGSDSSVPELKSGGSAGHSGGGERGPVMQSRQTTNANFNVSTKGLMLAQNRGSAFGALGTRARQVTRLKSRCNSNEGREFEDAVLQQRADSLAEQVCFVMYELSKGEKANLNKLGNQAMYDRNHALLKKIVKMMDTLRSLTGNARAPLVRNAPPKPPPGGKNARRLSMWTAAEDSTGDPLWGNLLYCLAFDNIICFYSPKTKVTMFRLFDLANAHLTQTNPPHVTPNISFLSQLLKDFFATEIVASPGAKLFRVLNDESVNIPLQNDGLDLKSVRTLPSFESYEYTAKRVGNCSTCGCEWFSQHYWAPGFCRSCFHYHPVIAAGAGAPSTHDHKGVGAGAGASSSSSSSASSSSSSSAAGISVPLCLSSQRRSSALATDALLPPAPDMDLVREMFQCLDPQNILTLYGALFGESRIVFSSSSNFRLKAVINTLLRLMYPFQWQHMFIPLLSRDCVGLLSSPLPFIIGVNSYLMDTSLLEPDLVVADLDANMVRYRPGLFVNFPDAQKTILFKTVVKFSSQLFLLKQAQAKMLVGIASSVAGQSSRHLPLHPSAPSSSSSSALPVVELKAPASSKPHHLTLPSGAASASVSVQAAATTTTTSTLPSLSPSPSLSLSSSSSSSSSSSHTIPVPLPSPYPTPPPLKPTSTSGTTTTTTRTTSAASALSSSSSSSSSNFDWSHSPSPSPRVGSSAFSFDGTGAAPTGYHTASEDASGVSLPLPHDPSLSLEEKVELQKSRTFDTLRKMRDGFLEVLIALFFKYRLFWLIPAQPAAHPVAANQPPPPPFELQLFLDHVKQDSQPFVQAFVRTLSFRKFLEVRQHVPVESLKFYLFDKLVEQSLRDRRKDFAALRVDSECAHLSIQRNRNKWHIRWVALVGTQLRVFTKKTAAEPKHARTMLPGSYRLAVPAFEQGKYCTFTLIPTESADSRDSFCFRWEASSRADRKRWIRLLRARLMEASLAYRYDRFV